MKLRGIFAGALALVSSTSAGAQVAVETYTGTGTYNFALPGTPNGSGIAFAEDLAVTSLTFTPGAVTFNGQPVDFSGTEASFLANTYGSGTTFVPVAAGPAVVDPTTVLPAAGGALNGNLLYEREGLNLGPGFSASLLDILPGPHRKPTISPDWSSPVVPELNGLPVEQDIAEIVTLVDMVLGIVDVSFNGAILAPENIVQVETYTGQGTYSFALPGAVVGPGVDFVEDLTVTGLSFTPGAVTFGGQPVDFSGTEADFLATTYTGTGSIPALAGPATVDMSGNVAAVGPALNTNFDYERRGLHLGPAFGANFFDVEVTIYPKLAVFPNWSSAVVPELNGQQVIQSVEEQITAVDAVNGLMDVIFTGSILAQPPPPVPAATVWGIALLLTGLLGSAVIVFRRPRLASA
jgi:hypothetical protein